MEIGPEHKMATIYIDDRAYEANPQQNLLHACLTLGFNLPYFCWHPAMGSVGACRQCAVKQFKDDQDKQGKIVMACMTPAAEGTRISIEDPEARAFRAGVIEGLMVNHPHDCPVCDEGGECHLQDMTVMTGHDYRRYTFQKRTFHNQYLGPFVNHEMNRCIQCYRCVRFYREYAGGRDFDNFGLRDHVFFGRHEDGVLENEFSGNLVEVCPTGVFTDKSLKQHYTRKWDLQMAPSICVHCGLGCNTTAGERYGMLRRIINRFNGEVNGYFLCDRGRYGYEFVNSDRRVRQVRLAPEGNPSNITKSDATQYLASLIGGEHEVIGIGSPRASLESNFLLRTLVGQERFYAGVDDEQYRLLQAMLEILRTGKFHSPSLGEIEISDAVLILGEDVTNVAPRMALTLRQSVRRQALDISDKMRIPRWDDHAVREALQDTKGPLFIASCAATRLDDVATRTYCGVPDDIARLGFAIAHAVDSGAPAVPGLSETLRTLAAEIAEALRTAQRPLVVSGPSCRSQAVIESAANVAMALSKAGQPAALSFTTLECNAFGMALMAPNPLGTALNTARQRKPATVIILENDLYRRLPAHVVDEFLNSAPQIVVLDHLENRTTEKAGLVLPAATFAEADGSLVSSEGRAQRFYQVYVPDGDIQPSWCWLRDALAIAKSPAQAWEHLDDVVAAMARDIPVLEMVPKAAPSASFRIAGEKVPREPHRYSGRTAMHANISVHEPKPPDDQQTPLTFSMEGTSDQPPGALIPFFWSPGWNSIQATNFYQTEIAGPLRGGDPGVRLIEGAPAATRTYFHQIPDAFSRRKGEWLLVPLYHIFGSEELSLSSPRIRELAPKPYIALSADDARELHLDSGDEVRLEANGTVHHLPLVIHEELSAGVVGVPVGLPSLGGINLPIYCTLEPEKEQARKS